MRAARASNVGAVVEDGVVYAAVLPEGPIFVLTDDVAAAWRAATEADAVSAEQEGYVAALVDAGLLTLEKES